MTAPLVPPVSVAMSTGVPATVPVAKVVSEVLSRTIVPSEIATKRLPVESMLIATTLAPGATDTVPVPREARPEFILEIVPPAFAA